MSVWITSLSLPQMVFHNEYMDYFPLCTSNSIHNECMDYLSVYFRWYFTMISMSGIFAVTFSVVFAYVADITTEEDRSQAYGLVRIRTSYVSNWFCSCSGINFKILTFPEKPLFGVLIAGCFVPKCMKLASVGSLVLCLGSKSVAKTSFLLPLWWWILWRMRSQDEYKMQDFIPQSVLNKFSQTNSRREWKHCSGCLYLSSVSFWNSELRVRLQQSH